MTRVYRGHGGLKSKHVQSSHARYGTSVRGLLKLIAYKPRGELEPMTRRGEKRKQRVLEMPPDYICHQCGFDSEGCLVCLDTDVLPIPWSELVGDKDEPSGSIFTASVQRELIVALRKNNVQYYANGISAGD